MISAKAKAIFSVLKLTNFKDKIDYTNPKRSSKNHMPQSLFKHNKVETYKIRDRNVHNITPLSGESNKHIVFFHGGGYVMEASRNNFDMIGKLIKLATCTVTFVQYPLSPEANVNQTIQMAYEAYLDQTEKYSNHEFILMGDSAGGGLALALSIFIKNKQIKRPEKLILFSPWLDIGLTNPDIKLFEDKDYILSTSMLKEAGKRYAHDVPLKDYRVSPMYGDLNNLGSILVFYGSEEIFKPDCEKFCNQTNLLNTKIKGIEYQDMQHDWVVLPILEQDLALADAFEFI